MNVVLYIRRNTGLVALAYLLGFPFKLRVISDDENILWLAKEHEIEITTLETMGDFDLFICVHGNKIIPKEYLKEGKMINIHPCLYKYRGANPVKRYILGKDTDASVESQWLIEEVDGGEVIHREDFKTPICSTYADFYNIALPFYIKCLNITLNKIGV